MNDGTTKNQQNNDSTIKSQADFYKIVKARQNILYI